MLWIRFAFGEGSDSFVDPRSFFRILCIWKMLCIVSCIVVVGDEC